MLKEKTLPDKNSILLDWLIQFIGMYIPYFFFLLQVIDASFDQLLPLAVPRMPQMLGKKLLHKTDNVLARQIIKNRFSKVHIPYFWEGPKILKKNSQINQTLLSNVCSIYQVQ